MTDWRTKKQAAADCKCSEKSIERAVKKGELPAYRPGKLMLFDPADLKSWVTRFCRVRTDIVTQKGRGRSRQTIINGEVWK